jgi:hypothetical protein
MKTEESDPGLGRFPQVQTGKLGKRKKMWGRLGRQLGTTSRAVPPAAGLTCCGELGTPHSQREASAGQECGADRPAYDQ